MKKEYITIKRLQFLKDCAKGMSLREFKNTYLHAEAYGIDLDKAYIILGGKVQSKKVFKKKKDE